MTRRVLRALRACRAALTRQIDRESPRLIGRWALPSGQTFRVVRIDGEGLALVGNGRQRWFILSHSIRVLADAGQLRYLGK